MERSEVIDRITSVINEEVMTNSYYGDRVARAALETIESIGWGDLAAERERAAKACKELSREYLTDSRIDAAQACAAAIRAMGESK